VIGVASVRKPATFDAKARTPGNAWLKANPNALRPRDFWSPYLSDLAAGFDNLCGYAAMYDPVGTVDHYLSFRARPDLAYEWSNYRFASHTLNASKKNADASVLDPHVVRDGWFEILLPSLQLQATDRIPKKWRDIADYTLERLKLRDGEKIIRWRRGWYKMYLDGELTLDGLNRVAPLIAAAVEKQHALATANKPGSKARKR